MSVIGFDLGNLASKIGCARKGGIDVLVNEVSNRATPSLISFGPRSRAIGESALTMQSSNYKNTVGSLKRLIGLTLEQAQEVESQFVTPALVDCDGEVGVSVTFAGEKQNFSATQLLGAYFGKLRDIAMEQTGAPVSDVAIAIPGWFTDKQRRAVLEASQVANLHCLRLINDTTAVALLWGITKTDLPDLSSSAAPVDGEAPSAPLAPKVVAFVDIGHSDYSVSISSFVKGSLTVKSTAYDRNFGGRNFDQALVHHFAEEFKTKYKIDVMSNPKAIYRLQTACEKLKKILSANAVAPLSVENIMNDVDAVSQLSREDFESLIAPFLNRIQVPLQEALAKANITVDQIDQVEVVGGSTRIPFIKEAISKFFGGKTLSFTLNQDEAIARGSTFACALLSPLLRVRPFEVKEINTYPIKLSWDAVPEDEQEESHSAVLFPAQAATAATKSVTFHRRADFDLRANYDNEEQTPIKTVRVTGVTPDAKTSQPSIVKARVKLNIHGVLTFTTAESLHEVVQEEAITTPEGDAMQTDEQPKEEASSAAPQTRKIRKLVKQSDLQMISIPAEDASILNAYREKEGQLHSSDKLVLETEERKNALEEYIYDTRNKTEDGGKLSAFITADERQALHSKLSEAEDWLYTEEGEEATKSTYVSKLNELKTLGNPVIERSRSAEERPKAASILRDTINKYMSRATGNDEKYSHISEEENQSVIEKAVLAQQWLDDLTARQAERAKNTDPILTVTKINEKCAELTKFASPIYAKAKPKAKTEPVPEAKPENASDADASKAQTNSTEVPGEMDVD